MSSDRLNRYWLPNLEINKKVITQELQFHLGPEANVRPYTRDGEDGFLITTPGPCLTDEQIDDICQKSKKVWEKSAAARSGRSDISDKPLKRPLHQPVLVSRGPGSGSASRHRDIDGRRSDESRRQRDDRRSDDTGRRRSDEEWRRDDRRR